jgi:hypothetical protein
MIRNALISSNTLFGKNNSQLLKVFAATNQQHPKREQKTMPVVERENPEKLPGSAFGW